MSIAVKRRSVLRELATQSVLAKLIMKKILISVFGCAPNRGSDAEVGWKWLINLAEMGYDVWAITREVNREAIEAELLRQPRANLRFIYFENTRALKWMTGIRGYLYYYVWQWGAYKKVAPIHKEIKFDLVHHVTWVSVRQPSFMGNLGIPFYFGPVAGGETAPWRLRRGYSLRQWGRDIFRDIANLFVKIDPIMGRTFSRATRIYVTSGQTCRLLPHRFQDKVTIQLAIARDLPSGQSGENTPVRSFNPGNTVRVLYVGRFIGWKGMHLGLQAFKKLVQDVPNAQLTLVGRGPDEKKWRAWATHLNIDRYLIWVPWLNQGQLADLYLSHDIFLFPSLHDSGGLVVLEAMSHGLPVVCLDLGGPGVIVNDSCGIAVKTADSSQSAIVGKIAESLLSLAQDPQAWQKLSRGAFARAKDFAWKSHIEKIYSAM